MTNTMTSIPLRYGCNPHQELARLSHSDDPSPLTILNGQPSYINILDALTAWQLVRELRTILGKPAAASYKHVSPAGAAVAGELSADFVRSQFLDTPPSDPIANAYIRARGADRVSSFGDAVAVAYVAHAGGAIRNASVRDAAREHGITVLETGIRAFLH